MSETITITEAGKKCFNLPSIHNYSREEEAPLQQAHSCSSMSHEAKLRQLPFKLNQLYKNEVIKQAESELKEGIKGLKRELLRDLGYHNRFTTRKAGELAMKLFQRVNEDGEAGSLGMELSKGRNYLGRINHLHGQHQRGHERTQRSLELLASKENQQ